MLGGLPNKLVKERPSRQREQPVQRHDLFRKWKEFPLVRTEDLWGQVERNEVRPAGTEQVTGNDVFE